MIEKIDLDNLGIGHLLWKTLYEGVWGFRIFNETKARIYLKLQILLNNLRDK